MKSNRRLEVISQSVDSSKISAISKPDDVSDINCAGMEGGTMICNENNNDISA